MTFWIVKCRQHLPDREGWSWDSYFDNLRGEYGTDDTWGGPDWIRSNHSKMFIREEVKKGDVIVCYQFEGRRICGLAVMAGDGRDEPVGSGKFNLLYISASSKAVRIEPELTVEQIRASGTVPKWLQRGQGTIFPLTLVEFGEILRAVRIHCPGMENKLGRWIKARGIPQYLDEASSVKSAPTKSAGSGFSGDLIRNRIVEEAAIRAAKRDLKTNGWKIEDVQANCVGYDLRCTKGKTLRLDVEVKGVAGIRQSFPITQGEVHQAKENRHFAIWVITDALAHVPKIQKYSGAAFLDIFSLKPIQYMAKIGLT